MYTHFSQLLLSEISENYVELIKGVFPNKWRCVRIRLLKVYPLHCVFVAHDAHMYIRKQRECCKGLTLCETNFNAGVPLLHLPSNLLFLCTHTQSIDLIVSITLIIFWFSDLEIRSKYSTLSTFTWLRTFSPKFLGFILKLLSKYGSNFADEECGLVIKSDLLWKGKDSSKTAVIPPTYVIGKVAKLYSNKAFLRKKAFSYIVFVDQASL